MSALGDEKKAASKFKISGKFTGGVGSSGVWTEAGGGRYGNDWDAEALAKQSSPTLTMAQRLSKNKSPERGDFADTVKLPGKAATPITKAKAAVKEQAKKSTSKAKSILSPRAESESNRLEKLFSGGISHPAQLIPAANAGLGMAGLVKDILKRKK
jgi:hypothetical protein